MALYKYQANQLTGQRIEVVIEGDSPSDALARLRSRNLTPVKFLGETGIAENKTHWRRRDGFDVYGFTNRLTPLLNAQIPLERALAIMADSGEKDRNHTVIVALRKGLHEGRKFSELIRSHGDRFPKIYANLIEAGEETGQLAMALKELQRFLNEMKEQRDFLITSSIYPATILVITLGVIILMFTVFIPRFSQIFMDMGKTLPLPTAIMLGISRCFTFLWPLWIGLPLLLWRLTIAVRHDGTIRRNWERTILRLPMLGALVQAVEMARFLRTLAVLLIHQVHLLTSVKIALRVIGNNCLAQSFDQVATDLREGKKLSAALRKSPYMPAETLQMLAVGEESGNVGDMLLQAADNMEIETRQRIKRLLALFEPAVIVFLALVVLAVVISIFLAVMEMNNI